MNWRLRLALEEIAVNSFSDATQIIEYISANPKAQEEIVDILKKYSTKYEIGEKVTFYYDDGRESKGIVKAISDQKNVFVVYSCNEDWEHYYDYTGQKSDIGCLTKGWKLLVPISKSGKYCKSCGKSIDELYEYCCIECQAEYNGIDLHRLDIDWNYL